ncbi:MAG: OmpA family protein [Bryobacterales bacterium]|nr:OmpA family protein [Bryobacterales bacterium]
MNLIDRVRMCGCVLVALLPQLALSQNPQPVDYLSFAQGAVPVAFGGAATALRAGMEQALSAIDGDPGGFSLTPRPGAADTEVWFVYRLPSATTFTSFAVPNVLETPSPSQTFFRDVKIEGSGAGPDGPFEPLAATTLSTHPKKDQVTRFKADVEKPVRWVKVSLRGGIKVERDQTFFEFSEIVGEGRQEPVPLLEAFTGKWKGVGVLLELKQDGARVTGCYDRLGDLTGTVSGNLLRATGTQRSSQVPSTFVLTVSDSGSLTGVRSTNGAPFKLYAGDPDPSLKTECSGRSARPPGCGDIVHGIQFDYDSATIRPDSAPVLAALHEGLKGAPQSAITIVGHTSSEGAEAYNLDLSQRRAAAVVAALVERGIAAARLSAKGAGESQPIADNRTEAGRSLNRRVEVRCQ